MMYRIWLCAPILVMVSMAASVDRGKELIQSRNFKAAETELQEAVNANADDAEARLYLGIAQTHMGRGGTAADTLRKAAELNSDSADIRYALAMAQVEAKQFGEAETTLKEAEGIIGDHPNRSSVKGAWLAAQRRFKEAVEPLEAAVAGNPADAFAHYYLGLAYSNLKRPDRMITHFEEFLRLEPDSPNAARVRGFLKNIR